MVLAPQEKAKANATSALSTTVTPPSLSFQEFKHIGYSSALINKSTKTDQLLLTMVNYEFRVTTPFFGSISYSLLKLCQNP